MERTTESGTLTAYYNSDKYFLRHNPSGEIVDITLLVRSAQWNNESYAVLGNFNAVEFELIQDLFPAKGTESGQSGIFFAIALALLIFIIGGAWYAIDLLTHILEPMFTVLYH